LDHPRN